VDEPLRGRLSLPLLGRPLLALVAVPVRPLGVLLVLRLLLLVLLVLLVLVLVRRAMVLVTHLQFTTDARTLTTLAP
jgi:hypothetical protein